MISCLEKVQQRKRLVAALRKKCWRLKLNEENPNDCPPRVRAASTKPAAPEGSVEAVPSPAFRVGTGSFRIESLPKGWTISGQRMAPPQTWKPGKVTICRDPIRRPIRSPHSRKISIAYEIAFVLWTLYTVEQKSANAARRGKPRHTNRGRVSGSPLPMQDLSVWDRNKSVV